jgi:glutamate/tyrosine decarboxylase-like PLP-dependent enzyme
MRQQSALVPDRRPADSDRMKSMFAYDAEMTDLVLDFARRRLREPAALDRPGDPARLGAALDGLVTAGGRAARDVLALYADHLAPAIISADSPRYLAFIPAAPTKASLLFDVVVSVSALEGTSWQSDAGAIAAENQTLRLLADLAGLPPAAGGTFVSGGSAGNLSALLVARDTAAHPQGLPARVAVSDQAHASVAKALHILGLEALVVPTEDHRLTEASLRAALTDDVIAIVATAGTTNAGIVDDLAGAARVARELGAWLHVDGAYGGAGLFDDAIRHRFAGIEHADSLIIDPHKWLMAPFDAAALLYRAPHLAKAVHTHDAAYLDPLRTPDAVWNASEYAYHLTRRARGLPLWFSLAVNGTDAYRDAIHASIALAERTARLIDATPRLELLREPELSTVIFRRTGWGPGHYADWSHRLLAEQIAYVAPTKWEGETIARLTFVNPLTTLDVVEAVLAGTA